MEEYIESFYKALRQPSADGVHPSEGIRGEVVPLVLTTAQEEDTKVVPRKHREKKLITTEASAEYRINPVLYEEFKRVHVCLTLVVI